MDLTPETLKGWHVWPKRLLAGGFRYQGKTWKKSELPDDVKDKRGRGWSDCGYHYYIDRQAVLHTMRPAEKIGAHCKGHNRDSIGIAMAGGVENGKPVFNFTRLQILTLDNLAKHWSELYNASIHGHNEFSSKACPSFDVKEWFYG